MAFVPETRYIRMRDGAHLAMQQFGSGPDVVVLTGGFSHVELRWEEPVLARSWRRIAAFARVTTYDQRGSGLSDRTAAPPSMETRVSDALEILDSAGVERATIHGSYEAGCVALVLAARHPDRVGNLVLESTAAKAVAAPDYPEGIPPDVWTQMLSIIERSSFDELVDLLAPSRANDRAFRAWFARWVRYGSGPGGLRALLQWIESLDVRPLLANVVCPVTVVHSCSDPLIPPSAARYLTSGVVDGRLVEVDQDTGWYSPTADVNLDVLEQIVDGRMHAFQDRLHCAIVFFDLVESTAHAARVGDAEWRRLLDQHDQAVTEGVLAENGRIVKTTGDGALAVFDAPRSAVEAARTVIAGVGRLGLSCRVGIHLGEVERRGDDVAGINVHAAARIAAAAEPNQVLVSEALADALAPQQVQPAGTRELRGFPLAWTVFIAG